MRTQSLGRKAAGALAAVLVAGTLGAAQAAGKGSAPWFGPPGTKPAPIGKIPAAAGAVRREAAFIRQLYRGFLGREPSGQEVRSWQEVLGERAGATEVIRSFMESDEYFVRQVYLGLLRREPDAAGRDAYLRAMDGGRTRADVIESVIESEEFRKLMR
jgi:hypothetical protein